MKMNEEQFKAVNAQEGRYLVAAGAGSGKTAVLSERALKLIKDGKCTIDELLVLTFTNDAAKEMKSRIYSLLKKDDSPLCQKAAEEIESASIMTFDALARAFVNEFGIEGDLGYGNATEVSDLLNLETRKILDTILEERYAKNDPMLLKLVYRHCNKDDNPITSYILLILDRASKRPDPALWLKTFCDDLYSDAFIKARAHEYQGRLLAELRKIYDDLQYIEDSDVAEKTANAIDVVYKALSISLNDAFQQGVIPSVTYRAKKGIERSEIDKESWERIRKRRILYNSLIEPYKNYDDFVKAIKENEEEIRYLFSLANEIFEQVLQRKRESGLYFFDDISLEASRLLDNKDVLKRVQSCYKFVMVDEYQDTSDTQIALLDKLAIPNIFMVGDAKQSIYRFRYANPKNFMDEKEMGINGKDGHNLLVLSKNYRSRESVLKIINAIFEKGMSIELGGIDYYGGKESLEFGNVSFSSTESSFHGYEIHRLEADSIVGDATGEWIAADIYRKLTEGYRVKDKATGGLRNCSPNDFAILASSKKNFSSYKRILERYGIPCDVGEGEELTSKDDVMLISSLATFYLYLFATDEVGKGKRRHAYASIRKSYLHDDSDEEIYNALKDDQYLKEDFYLDAVKHHEEVTSSSVLSAYDFFFEHYHFLDRINRKSKVKASLTLLSSIRDQAISMDRLNYSFEDFATYFSNLKAMKLSSKDTGERRSGEAVKLFSIHKSKGLQYPIVYLPSLESRFNLKDSSGTWFLSPTYGAGIPNKGPANPLLWLNKAMEKKASVDEEVRKFYVAATRAEELLVFVETSKKNKEGEEKDFAKEEYSCYRNILARSGIDQGVKTENVIKIEGVRYTPEEKKSETLPLHFRRIEPQLKENKKASPSKKTLFDDSFEKRKYGLRMHRYMEILDFDQGDTSFISNKNERERIEKILKLPLFSEKKDRRTFKEYSYINEDGSNGIIDLMFVYADKVVIIDYKSSYIDDPAYISQVSQYCEKAKALFSLPVEGYLLSLHNAEAKKVY